MKHFVPFYEIKKHKNVVGVDCFHPNAFCLSHWRGAPIPKNLQDDTSAGIVLNALKYQIPELSFPLISSNHFDVDGFVGVWSLFNSEIALQYENVLKQMALIGDFREFNAQNSDSYYALKLVCWINTLEKKLFYAPFGAQHTPEKEAKLCVEKIEYFLPRFKSVLLNPEIEKENWEAEYNKVLKDLQLLNSRGSVQHFPGIRLQVVLCPEPIHYYALFSKSENSDMVLALYDNNRFELEYKYTTWINAYSRLSYPRISMAPLAKVLNNGEEYAKVWDYQNITDTGPILRLNGNCLSKEQRFDHPFNRTIESSSWEANNLVRTVVEYYERNLGSLEKKNSFTWEEMKKLSKLAIK